MAPYRDNTGGGSGGDGGAGAPGEEAVEVMEVFTGPNAFGGNILVLSIIPRPPFNIPRRATGGLRGDGGGGGTGGGGDFLTEASGRDGSDGSDASTLPFIEVSWE